MSTTTFLAQQSRGEGIQSSGGGGDWDLVTLFENMTEYGQVAGGAFLSLMGLIGVIWGATLLVKKLLSEQSRESWVKIVALLIIGGALLFSGITLVLKFAEGGRDTIEEFGTGAIVSLTDFSGVLAGSGLF